MSGIRLLKLPDRTLVKLSTSILPDLHRRLPMTTKCALLIIAARIGASVIKWRNGGVTISIS